jgi:hypothetical protein
MVPRASAGVLFIVVDRPEAEWKNLELAKLVAWSRAET